MKKLSPAPATSLGQDIEGRQAVREVLSVLSRGDQKSFGAECQREVLCARLSSIQAFADLRKAGFEVVQGEAGFALGRGQQRHALEARNIAKLHEDA